METLSEGLKHWHDCYLLGIVFSSQDAGVIQEIQDGVLEATKFFEVRLCIVQLGGNVSDITML